MTTAPDPSAESLRVPGDDLTESFAPLTSSDFPDFTDSAEISDDLEAPVDTHSTRLMLTTAAHFVQQHLHSQLVDLGLSPLGLSVLNGLAELQQATGPEVAGHCLLSETTSEDTFAQLQERGFVHSQDGVYSMTDAGGRALSDARELEDSLFAEKSTTLRMELSSLISRLRDGGVLDPK